MHDGVAGRDVVAIQALLLRGDTRAQGLNRYARYRGHALESGRDGERAMADVLEMLALNVRSAYVLVALIATLVSQIALKQWALPRIAELADNKTYFVERNVPWLFDGRRSGYSALDAKMHLDALGARAREYYAQWYIPVYDLIFPIMLFVFGVLFCLWTTQPRPGLTSGIGAQWRFVILIVPLALFIFDMLENLSVFIMLKSYPRQGSMLVAAASVFTQAKWISAYSAGAVALFLTVMSVVRWWHG
jgi:hypothetical protein